MPFLPFSKPDNQEDVFSILSLIEVNSEPCIFLAIAALIGFKST